MEKEALKKVLDTYTRYLNSIKKKETDIDINYTAMKRFLTEHCEKPFRNHIVQDAYVNYLRSSNSNYAEIKPSSVIALLMKSQDDFEKVVEAMEEKELEEAEFKETKERYFKALDELNFKELSWKEFNTFKTKLMTDINTSTDISPNVRHRVSNVIKMKIERDKFKLL